MSVRDEVRQALDLHKQGKSSTALTMLKYLSHQYPDEELVWQGLAMVTRSRVEKLYAVEQVLRVNPNNQQAVQYRDKLQAKMNAVTEAKAAAEPVEPVITPDPPPDPEPQPIVYPPPKLTFLPSSEAPTLTQFPVYAAPVAATATPMPLQPTPITQPTPHYQPPNPLYAPPIQSAMLNAAPKTATARGIALLGSVLIVVGLLLPFGAFKFTYFEYSAWTGQMQTSYDFYEDLSGVQGWGSQFYVAPDSAIYRYYDNYTGSYYVGGIADYAKSEMLNDGLPIVIPLYGIPILLTLLLRRRFATYRKIQAVGAVALAIALIGLLVGNYANAINIGMVVYAAGLLCWMVAGVIRLPVNAPQPSRMSTPMSYQPQVASTGGSISLHEVIERMTKPLHGWKVVSDDGNSVVVQKTLGINQGIGYAIMFLFSALGMAVVMMWIASTRRRYVVCQPQLNGPVLIYDEQQQVREVRNFQDLHDFYRANQERLTYGAAMAFGLVAIVANVFLIYALG